MLQMEISQSTTVARALVSAVQGGGDTTLDRKEAVEVQVPCCIPQAGWRNSSFPKH